MLLIVLLVGVVLRLPSLFEPYWYGDEAIYLTIGTGLKQGFRLYTDIIDHKTPLIYYFAMVPNQFWFRVLMMGWMFAANALFFSFARRLFKNVGAAFASSLVFVLLTTLPWFEGHIPNGELFVIGFVMAGLWVFSRTKLFEDFLEGKNASALKSTPKEIGLLITTGALMSLGVLTKVPGLFDFGAVLLVGWWAMVRAGWKTLGRFIFKTGMLFVGLLIPIVLSIVYYVALGSGQDYLDYGLLYNFRYSGSWQLDLNPFLQMLFTLPGKGLLMVGSILALSFLKKYPPRFQFIAGWFVVALFASLLSNRPYPHYFLQIVPPASLLVAELVLLAKRWKRSKVALLTGAVLLLAPFAVGLLLDLRPYATKKYYEHFYRLMSRQITMEEYDSWFNPLVRDNYAAADVIYGLNGHRIFIWGTNPMLYALTHTTPASRFTVSFHIKDFDDYERTFAQIEEEKPKIIVVMKNESQTFPQLEAYLNSFYVANTQYETMTIYLRQNN